MSIIHILTVSFMFKIHCLLIGGREIQKILQSRILCVRVFVFSHQTGSCSEHPGLPGCVGPRPAWCRRWRPAGWNALTSRGTTRRTYRDRYPRFPPDPGRIPAGEGRQRQSSFSVIIFYRFLCFTYCITLESPSGQIGPFFFFKSI